MGKKIAIYGFGGFGREVKSLIEDINTNKEQYEFIGFFDDNPEIKNTINNYTILGGIKELNAWNDEISIAVAIGDPITKKSIVQKINNPKVSFPNLIHPSVIGNPNNYTIGHGCIICANNILTVDITIGNFLILNLACTIGHDTLIKDFCSIMPGVNVSGEVELGACSYIGTGAKIINLVHIGKNTIVGAGAVVSKSLPENCTAVGIPAKPIKFSK
ncbi:transferase [Dokdonia pacifica]|uniref:Sugar O-acyltransferase, sialic acid O-acetyltransferase NeuD family n=1 Tax=Dokdonia pacifica TaxID=1627892 RepID=A0A238YL30_9FLAO|nr:acetyltransferase [Dokdonia pacifica]GGG11465.1 transferase [Dokdonia pacifica]SNR71875.1 sugar O-acyltransferase, sialic acid O-acetyltransferase NeuD family [Dokdonia pacifica]